MNSNKSKVSSLINKVLSVIFREKVAMTATIKFFKKFRKFSDGITFFKVHFGVNIKGMGMGCNGPQFRVFLCVLNYTIVEFYAENVYEDEELPDTPYKLEPKQ